MKPPHFLAFLLVCLSCIICCSDDDDSKDERSACGVANILEDLDWLRDEIADREQSTSPDIQYCYITKATWNGQTVFLYEDCNPLINKVVPVLDCEGTSLGAVGVAVDRNELSDFCTVWSPDNFACLIDFSCVVQQ
ncbi:hypothetical protein WIW50_00725 [Flavobacteriaceae bacterium 3-367]|uniref:hypothetical protein n=1 Tax=Eudoraea algarum TaxID=3417568 RepID=UPI00328B63EF